MRASRLIVTLLLLTSLAYAGGPRFVTGPPFFTAPAGQAIGWKQPQLLYYTDPGALGTSVDHQDSDAIVAAAASAWNLPVASITIAQGGALAEHVSGQNTYLDTSGLVFPSDVMASNAAAIPVAILYDTDGSLTDLLLGSGASLPSGCRQNGVTESVDAFDPAGYILHAIVIVNGRCSGPAPEQQFQLQYQLERAFGRILGLAWSQTNDNVFTGTPTPTYAQAMNWPIMHPLDIICGAYTYQCLPSPFKLRADDIASMVAVYPVSQSPAAGKNWSVAHANALSGHLSFPTGEGMAGVNVLVRREPFNTTAFDSWYETSAVTGAYFRVSGSPPFVVASTDAQASFGSADLNQLGAWSIAYVPLEDEQSLENVTLSTEPINPLYMGAYSLGPYAPGNVAPSGSAILQSALAVFAGGDTNFDFTIPDAPSTCGEGEDGTAQAPMTLPATGWWNGLLCGYGHVSWIYAAVRPARSFTVEVTALDENGLATTAKMMPVIGLYAPSDTPGSDPPSLGVTPSAFNGNIAGTTTLGSATGTDASLTIAIADQRGDGRPDFNYQARFFYADTVLPAELPIAGGAITITGSGFRAGNAVTINGVSARVASWTADTITLTAPSMGAVKAVNGTAVDIVVSDLTTGASSTMTGALTYTTASALPNSMRLASAPAGTQFVGQAAATPFAVQLLGPDGKTPVAGQPVVFSAAAGSVTFGSCSSSACTATTDADGMASFVITPTTAGAITLQAADGSLQQSASFTAQAQAGYIQIWLSPSGNQPVGLVAGLVALTDHEANGYPLAGRSITFSAVTGTAIFSGCSTPVCTVMTDDNGNLLIQVTPTSIGPITIQAADGDVTSTFSFTSVSNTDVMQIATLPTPSVYTGNSSGAFAVNLWRADGVTPDQNQIVTFTASTGVTIYPCLSNVCAVSTAGSGQASVGVSDLVTGIFTIQAAFGSLTQSATFAVLPHTMQLRIVSAPSGNIPLGAPVATPFSVQLLQDGVTPVAGQSIVLAAPPGEALLSVCGYLKSSCWFTTDSNGTVSTSVTPLAPGAITLNAVFSNLSQFATFIATGPAETMTVTQQPGPGGVFVGDTINLALQITAAGGGPYAGDLVSFTLLSGGVGFDWYAGTVNRSTDTNGIVTQTGVAGSPGTVTILVADAVTSQTITFPVKVHLDQMVLLSQPASGGDVGAAAPIPFSVQVFQFDGVTPAANRTVTVSVTNGSASLTGCGGSPLCSLVTDSKGVITSVVTPLSTGLITLSAAETGAQQSASFIVLGSPAADLQLSIVSGASQSVSGGAPLSPVVVLVQDSAGHPVADVPLSIYQTVTTLDAVCPTRGRCPAAQILVSQATVATTAPDGTVRFVPLSVPGISTQTEIALAAGSSAFDTTILISQP